MTITSCNVEAINAVWTAMAHLIAAIALVVLSRKVIWGETSKYEILGSARIPVLIICCLAMFTGIFWFNINGQNALRYMVADSQGYECRYDKDKNVTIVTGNESPTDEVKE